jgi:transposase
MRMNSSRTMIISTPEPADDQPSARPCEARQSQAQLRKDVPQRRREVIVLLERQVPMREIAASTGYCPRAVSYIAQRYRECGLAALEDRRRCRAGAPQLLTPEQQQELTLALSGPPLDGGEWTGPKVASWIADRTGRPVHRQRGWEYLQRLIGKPEQAKGHSDE